MQEIFSQDFYKRFILQTRRRKRRRKKKKRRNISINWLKLTDAMWILLKQRLLICFKLFQYYN